jgi:hypothetical protein
VLLETLLASLAVILFLAQSHQQAVAAVVSITQQEMQAVQAAAAAVTVLAVTAQQIKAEQAAAELPMACPIDLSAAVAALLLLVLTGALRTLVLMVVME